MFGGKFHYICLFWEDLLIWVSVVIFKKRDEIPRDELHSSELEKLQNFEKIANLLYKSQKSSCKLKLFVLFELKFVFQDFYVHSRFLVKDKAFFIIYHAVFEKFIVLLVFVPTVFLGRVSDDRGQYFIEFERNITNDPGFLVHLSLYSVVFSFVVAGKEFIFQISPDGVQGVFFY